MFVVPDYIVTEKTEFDIKKFVETKGWQYREVVGTVNLKNFGYRENLNVPLLPIANSANWHKSTNCGTAISAVEDFINGFKNRILENMLRVYNHYHKNRKQNEMGIFFVFIKKPGLQVFEDFKLTEKDEEGIYGFVTMGFVAVDEVKKID